LKILRTSSYEKINECLYIFMDIFEMFVLNMKSLDLEDNMKEIRELVVNINNELIVKIVRIAIL